MRMDRKAQEEMIGFVLIVIVVAVIFLVFLGLAFSQTTSSPKKQSKELSQFLESVMKYTTDCSISYTPSRVEDLISKCYEESGSLCSSGEKVCSSADKTLKAILKASWVVGPESAYKGYKFESFYNSTSKQPLVAISEGNCTGNFAASEYLIPSYSGTIISSFKLCS